jgi:hypothetical protein
LGTFGGVGVGQFLQAIEAVTALAAFEFVDGHGTLLNGRIAAPVPGGEAAAPHYSGRPSAFQSAAWRIEKPPKSAQAGIRSRQDRIADADLPIHMDVYTAIDEKSKQS